MSSAPPGYGNLAPYLSALAGTLRYVHVTIYYDMPIPDGTFEQLKKAIEEMSLDWLKYANQSWILYTRETPEGVYKKLLEAAPGLKNQSIMTFYFDQSVTKSGQQYEWVWNWINKKR